MAKRFWPKNLKEVVFMKKIPVVIGLFLAVNIFVGCGAIKKETGAKPGALPDPQPQDNSLPAAARLKPAGEKSETLVFRYSPDKLKRDPDNKNIYYTPDGMKIIKDDLGFPRTEDGRMVIFNSAQPASGIGNRKRRQ
jgi:hypothetical protein